MIPLIKKSADTLVEVIAEKTASGNSLDVGMYGSAMSNAVIFFSAQF